MKALREKASVSQSIGVFLLSLQTGGVKDLLVSWLMQRKPQNETQSANAAATMELVEQESGKDQDFIYISSGGQRFTSLQQALQYAQRDKLRNRMAPHMKALQMDSFDHNPNIHVQFTSDHEDQMHHGRFEMSWRGSLEAKQFSQLLALSFRGTSCHSGFLVQWPIVRLIIFIETRVVLSHSA